MDASHEEIAILRQKDLDSFTSIDTAMRAAFWRFYLDPLSPTVANGTQSALRAGFEPDQAKSVTAYKWFKSQTLKDRLLEVAESSLEEMMYLPSTITKMVKGEEVVVTDPAMIKIKQDTAKFIASTLGKKYYSARTELSGKGGGAIQTQNISISDDEFNNIINAHVSKRDRKQLKDNSPEETV